MVLAGGQWWRIHLTTMAAQMLVKPTASLETLHFDIVSEGTKTGTLDGCIHDVINTIIFLSQHAGGYANEVGESFRYQYPRLVLPSYAIAFGYCFADAAYESYQVMAEDSKSGDSTWLCLAVKQCSDQNQMKWREDSLLFQLISNYLLINY